MAADYTKPFALNSRARGSPMVKRRWLAVALFVFTASIAAADDTPPIVTPSVSGTFGDSGWYISDVGISSTIVDEESNVFTTTGCEGDVLTQDDTARTYTCSATSDGGTTVVSETISRDTLGPVIDYSGHQSTYEIGEQVQIFCNTFDATSGVASTTCTDILGSAMAFDVGTHVFTSTATDNAGNVTTTTVSFDVVVTHAGLAALVNQYVTKASVAKSLIRNLEAAAAGNARAIDSFIRTVTRETGRSISAEDAATLLRLVALL